MKYIIMLLTGISLFVLSGCSGKQAEAEALFETAQFEELQNNSDHAKKLYQDIMKRYPKSKYAEKAKVKMAALEK